MVLSRPSEQLRAYFQQRLERAKKLRELTVVLPLEMGNHRPRPRELKAAAESMIRLSTGEWRFRVGPKTAHLRWREFPVVVTETDDPGELENKVPVGTKSFVSFSDTPKDFHAFSYYYSLLPEDHGNVLVKSLRNTIKQKRRQYRGPWPYAIALGLGHHRLKLDSISSILVNRIWSNPIYDWLSAVFIYTPRSDFKKDSLPQHLALFQNPNAQNPVPQSLVDIIAAETPSTIERLSNAK